MDYWFDLLDCINNDFDFNTNFTCGKRYIDDICTTDISDPNIKWWKDGEKCGGKINILNNNLICEKCEACFGIARGKDDRGLEHGIVTLLKEGLQRR